MLINPDDEELRFLGGLGRVILSKGGSSIKDECEEFIRNNGPLESGDVFVTDGGNLNAKYISHILSQEWKNGQESQTQMLCESVFNCLLEATKRGLSSIGIPAIGCGVNGFPPDVATRSIVSSVKTFFLEVQDSSLTEVYICDIGENTVGCFKNALCSIFGQEKVTTVNIEPLPMEYMNDVKRGISRRKKTSKVPTPKENNMMCPIIKTVNGVTIGNITIETVKGEIAKQNVDVIVNTTAGNLDLSSGAVSLSLLSVAGAKLQEEANTKYPNGLKGTRIAVTTGHNLTCKQVFHTSLCDFDDKNEMKCRKSLFDIIFECLEEAEKQEHSSIAMPAFGTGQLGYPHRIVAEEMYKSVISFGRTNSIRNLQSVYFVLFHKDNTTIQAFENEQSKLSKDEGTTQTKGGKNRVRSIDLNDSDSITRMFGKVKVTVKHGDLLTEMVNCIVNSTNKDMDLSIGAVSKAILQKGGQKLKDEIDEKKDMMKSEHFVITSAPNLPCKRIIHIVLNASDVSNIVLKCLEEVEQLKKTSIAFPALGTGMNTSDVSMTVQGMIDAVSEFSKRSPKHLRDVRFVIFQKTMLNEFTTVVGNASETKSQKGLMSYFMTGVKGVKGFFSGGNDGGELETSQVDKADVNQVTFCIHSLSEDEIDKAIRKLDSFLEKEVESKIFTDYIIQQLDSEQVLEIKSIANKHHIDIKIDQKGSTIKIFGMKDTFFKAYDKLQGFIKDAMQMDYMSNIAQWYTLEITKVGEEVQPYDKELNLKIETAYRQNAQQMGFTSGGIDYIINFEKMEEYPEDDKESVATVLRRNVVKGGSFDIPPNWGDMQGGNLRVVDLRPHDQEYKDVEQNFVSSIDNYTFNVERIQRVQNKTLWEQYQCKRKQLEEKNQSGTQNERMLWHGTKAEAVDSINAHGFNRGFCGANAVAYGNGVYFAVEADYSCNDTYSVPCTNDGMKRMYYCRVLTGEYTTGKYDLRQPPAKPNGGPNNLYDSVINDPNDLKMFVVFNDTQAYPEYLLSFK